MPRIPLSEGRQLLPQRHDAVHAPTVIGGDFGMGDSRALIEAGDRIRGAGEKIAGAGLAFASALVDKENRLAAAEDRNLLNRYMRELNVKLASNPNASDEQKNEWIAERARQYDEERKPYLDKMSANFRKQHDLEIDNIRISYRGEQQRIMAAGQSQRVYDHYKSLLKAAGERGDLVEYQRIIGEAQGGDVPVFSKEEAERLKLDYQHLADFGEAKRDVDANEPNIDTKLRERDKNGNYIHFKNLTLSEREQLARSAKVNRHEAEFERNQAFLAGLNDGSISTSPEELKAQHERDEISDAEYNTRKPWVEAFFKKRSLEMQAEWQRGVEAGEIETDQEQVQRQFEQGEIDAETRDARLEYLQKRENASEKARNAANARWAKSDKNTREDKINAFKLHVADTQWSSDPSVNVEQREKLLGQMEKLFADDPDALLKLREHVGKASREGAAGKGVFNTGEGKIVFDFIKDKYRNDNSEYQGLKWDPWGPQKDKSQEFMAARYYEIMDYAKERLAAGDNAQKVIADIKERVERLNDGKIKVILDRRTYGRAGNKSLSVGTEKNGYQYVGGDPAKKESWKKIK